MVAGGRGREPINLNIMRECGATHARVLFLFLSPITHLRRSADFEAMISARVHPNQFHVRSARTYHNLWASTASIVPTI